MEKKQAVIDCLLKRRSIRTLEGNHIPQQDIELMLECMEAAPSAGNLQPWRFFVIRNKKLQKELCRLSFEQKAVEQAPVVFAVCAVPAQSAKEYGERGAGFFCIQDTACCVENLLLAVEAMGYGAVWIGVVNEKEIAAALKLPAGLKPVALIPVGQKAEQPGIKERRGFAQITTYLD